jgi:Tfp pilus assembly protein PilF
MKRLSWRWVLLGVLLLVWLLLHYIDKQAPQALIRKGGAHLQAKEYPQAVEAFSRAIEIDRTSAEAFHGRAMAYLYSESPTGP